MGTACSSALSPAEEEELTPAGKPEAPDAGRADADHGRSSSERELDQAYEALERELPDRLARAIRWLRSPNARWWRIPIGLIFILCSFLWFLPIVGVEFLPVGLLLLSQDIPFLGKPTARALMWSLRKWSAIKKRFRTGRSRSPAD